MDFIVSSTTQQQLASKLVDAGVLQFAESGISAGEGILFSYIGYSENQYHAFVAIDEAVVLNATDIFNKLKADINKPGAPLRAKLGSVPPEVIFAIPDYAIRKALESLGLSANWDTAINAVVTSKGSKDVIIWWERATQISTIEQEWKDIVAVMVWKGSSEAALIDAAKTIAGIK